MREGVKGTAPGTRTVTVLLADAHCVVRSGVRAWLIERGGFRLCAEASTTSAAQSSAFETRPDIVVLDPLLPGHSCVDLIRRVRTAMPSTEVLVYAEQPCELAAAAAVAGAKAVALKTDPPETFFHAIEALVAHRSFTAPRVEGAKWARLRDDATAGLPSRLTPRERAVARLMADSHTTREISAALHISEKTVESHRGSIMRKIGARSVAGVTAFAMRNGLA